MCLRQGWETPATRGRLRVDGNLLTVLVWVHVGDWRGVCVSDWDWGWVRPPGCWDGGRVGKSVHWMKIGEGVRWVDLGVALEVDESICVS